MASTFKAHRGDYHATTQTVKALTALLWVLFGSLVLLILSALLNGEAASPSLMAYVVSAVAALLVSSVASRLLSYHLMARADDRLQRVVEVSHYGIAIVRDLKARVGFEKAARLNGGTLLTTYIENSRVIQLRYESLYDRHLYLVLPGTAVDMITGMSGHVFGMAATVLALARTDASSQIFLPAATGSTERDILRQSYESFEAELQALVNEFYNIRSSAD